MTTGPRACVVACEDIRSEDATGNNDDNDGDDDDDDDDDATTGTGKSTGTEVS